MAETQNTRYSHICINCMEEKGAGSICSYCGFDESRFTPHPSSLRLRTFLHDRYLIGRVLGQGGFGITYLGFDTGLYNKKVAIKEYFPSQLVSRAVSTATIVPMEGERDAFFQQGLNSFLEEARNILKFSENPSIVNVYDFFKAHGTGYMAMEFIEGITLADFLTQQGGKISINAAKEIVLPLLDTLEELHAARLYHRDISPHNIMITRQQLPVLIDFGAARYVVGKQSNSLSLVVKPGYSPFEQYTSRGEIGSWTDIYACGATLYVMISGCMPPPSPDRIQKDDLRPPSRLLTNLSAQQVSGKKLDNLLLHALAVDKSDRFETIAEFKAALKDLDIAEKKRSTRIIIFSGALLLFIAAMAMRGHFSGWTRVPVVHTPIPVVSAPPTAMPTQTQTPTPVPTASPTPIPTATFTPSPTPAPTPSFVYTPEKLKDFIMTYITISNQGDLSEILTMYAGKVDYFGKGVVDKAFIRKDKAYYYNRWEQVNSTLKGNIIIIDTPEEDVKLAEFSTDFWVHSAARGQTISGTARNTMKIRYTQKQFEIIDEKQEVLSRKKT